MMEDMLMKMMTQVPNMAALVIVVALFMRVLSKWIDTLTKINDRGHEHGARLDADYKMCVDKNTDALDRMHEQTGQVITLLKKANGNKQ